MTASINFPSYGKIQYQGYSEKPRPNIYRTNMEGGPPKQARKYSLTFVERTVSYIFTAAEYATFKTWFYTTSQYGALWFNWNDPVDGTNKIARIMNGQITANPIGAGGDNWLINFTLETYQ
jgi:hypothetical protein